ncbi:MAG: helix-turn-helix domain-containing protein [Nitrososphaerales archaeon]
MTPGYVRTLIHSFNLHGFKGLKPDWKLGGNRKIVDEEKDELVSLATSRPAGSSISAVEPAQPKSEAEKRRIVDSISK